MSELVGTVLDMGGRPLDTRFWRITKTTGDRREAFLAAEVAASSARLAGADIAIASEGDASATVVLVKGKSTIARYAAL